MSSVDNALKLMRILGERQQLRVNDAAEALGVAPSTAHRLLSRLREHGFAAQERANGPYRSGPALNEIGFAAVGRLDLRQVAAPTLIRLRATVDETVSLAMLEGTRVRFIACVESSRPVRVGDRTGVVLPAHVTAVGKSLLALLPPGELESRYPDHKLEAWAVPNRDYSWDWLLDELDEVRHVGYAMNVQESVEGINAIAAGIANPLTNGPAAAIALGVPASRMPDRSAASMLADALLAARDQLADDLHTAAMMGPP